MKVSGVVEQEDLAFFSVMSLPDRPGAAGGIFQLLGENDINLEFISENMNLDGKADISFCVNSSSAALVENLIGKQSKRFGYKSVRRVDDVAIIGIYGPHFREKPGVASTFCSLLGMAGINILSISSSISTVCCVIDRKNTARAKSAIRSQFQIP